MGVTKIIGSVEGRIPPLVVLSPNKRAMMRRDVEYKLRGVSRGLAYIVELRSTNVDLISNQEINVC